MGDLASLYIKVDSSGVVTASKDLNKLTGDSKNTEKATDGVAAGFSKLKVAVVALATSYAALKMAKYIKDATLLAARYETLGVVMRVVGNNAGYSASQMDTFERGLHKTGIAMVESRTTLARMVQAQIDLTKSTELARIAQDAAVIGNINSSESFERMILGIQRGMPRILTTIGLNVSFNQSYKDLADSLNINVGALTELQRVQARTNAVIKSGVLIQGSYEGAMETAGKQVLSLTRHLDNLKVLFGTVFTPALAEIIGAITGTIKDLNSELEKNKEGWADWGAEIRLVLIRAQIEGQKWLQEFNQMDTGLAVIGLLITGISELSAKMSGRPEGSAAFRFFADMFTAETDAFIAHEKTVADLEERYEELAFSMTDAGKEIARVQKEVAKAFTPEATTEKAGAATKKQLKIQEDFAKAYNKSILTTQEFELASLKIKVDAFRAAKVNEIQLEEWMQNEIKNIKLRAQNEELELLEELAENDSDFAERAIEVMGEILDAEEKKWAKILRDDDAAHTLRIQKEEAYRDKILGTIEDIVVAQEEATQRLAPSGVPTANISPGPSAAGPSGGGDQFFVFRNQTFGSEADVQAYIRNLQAITDATRSAAESAARIAQAAADESSRILQRAADDAAREMQDIADQRVELEIQILEQTGHVADAVGIRRMLELAAMDESLRPLQQRLFFLEDEAAANREAADAAEEAAKATRDLARAQDAAIRTWRGSISTLVSQGRAIQDFINSLGAVGSSITLSAARAAFSADLASAQAGDPSAFNRITQSAGTFISTAATTVGSSVDLARIVAGVKSELSKLDPVIELDQNIELLKLIEKNTSTTATATERLDIVGIKAIFDLEQTLTLIADSTGLPEHLQKMIVAQVGDYTLWLEAKLEEDTPEDIKRLLIDGANTYTATINAIAGTFDDDSTKLISAKGDFITTVNAAFGEGDDTATKLAITASGEYTASVVALYKSADPNSQKLAIDAGGKFIADVEAAFEKADPKSQILALDAAGIYVATVNAVFGEADTESTKLALTALGIYTTTVDAVLSADIDADAKKLGLSATNSIVATIGAILSADIDSDTLALALETTNAISTTVTALISSDIDPDAQALGLNTVNTLVTTVSAAMSMKNSQAALQLGLAVINEITSTVTAAMGFSDEGAVSLALNRANEIAATVTAALGSGDADALTLATESANTFSTIVTAALATDADTQQLKALLTGGTTTTTTVEGLLIWNPDDPLKAIFDAIQTATETTATNTAKFVAAVPTNSTSRTIEATWIDWFGNEISGSQTTSEQHGLLLYSDGTQTPYAHGGVFTNGIVSQPTLFNNSQMGEAGPEAIMPLVRSSEGLGVRVMGGDTSPEQTALLKRIADAIETGNFAIAKNTGKSAKILTEFDFNGMPAERTIN